MMTDGKFTFVSQYAAPVSAVGAAGSTITLGQVIDLLGSGVGTAPANIIGNASVFGTFIGVGSDKPELAINIGTAFTTGNAATGEFAWQVAADQGSAGGYQPGAWEDAATTGYKATTEMPATGVVRMNMPPAPPATPRPRYMQLVLRVPAGTNFSAGTVTFAGIVFGRDDLVNNQAAGNFTVS